MVKCPYCGSEKGYYVTETIRRALYFTFENEPNFSSEDMIIYAGKRKRCINCQKALPREEVGGMNE